MDNDDILHDMKLSKGEGGSILLPQALIELAIVSIATRTNYGLDGPGKIPAALSLWRWEVKENYRAWLPTSVQDKLQARRLERQQAKEDLRRIFDALPATEREALLKTNKKPKVEGAGIITFSVNRSGSDENVPIPSSQGTTDVSIVKFESPSQLLTALIV